MFFSSSRLSKERKAEMRALRRRLGVSRVDLDLLSQSLTHTSFCADHRELHLESNERLEFLGDSVLGLIMAEYLHQALPDGDEGVLTQLKSTLVSTEALAEKARTLGIGDYVLLGRGEARRHGHERLNLLADCFEAMLAAIYLGRGLGPAAKFVQTLFAQDLEKACAGQLDTDYKSRLVEYCQKRRTRLSFDVTSLQGPAHHKVFTIVALVNGAPMGTGTGTSKRRAQQAAARAALQKIHPHLA